MDHPDIVYPNQEDVLRQTPLLEWIDEHYLRHDPFAFGATSFTEVVRSFCSEFAVDPNGIYCIGSGAVGLSVNPTKIIGDKLKRFDENSDLDIAIISEVHFETAWRDLRRAAQPFDEMNELLRKNLNWQKKRFFDGAILANKLLPELSFGTQWLLARVRINQQISQLLGRDTDVNMWIYRDYWSLRNYVANSIVGCRKAMI